MIHIFCNAPQPNPTNIIEVFEMALEPNDRAITIKR